MNTADVLTVENLTVRYLREKKPVIKNISFSIKRGEVLLVLGPTGGGKSTLLYAISGVIPNLIPAHVEGKIRVLGQDPSKESLSRLSRRLGLVLQDPEAQTIMFTVEEELMFPLENLRFDVKTIMERINTVLEKTGLKEYRKYEVDILSTGLKQRLALASIMAIEPDIMLLDEPTAHIDPYSSYIFYRIVKELKDEGKSIILVEHRLEYVEEIIDKILYIDNGHGIVVRSIEELVKMKGLNDLIKAGIWLPTRFLNSETLSETQTRVSEETIIEANNVEVKLDGNTILEDINITVKKGEMVVLIGKNGSGKTTLLKTFAGIIPPYKGEIKIMGSPPSPNKVVFVTQIPEHMFVERKVLDEIAITYRLLGYDKQESIQLSKMLLQQEGLIHLAEKSLYKISQGEKRLISLLAVKPLNREIFLLDEPTFGLDMKYSLTVLKSISSLRKMGKTILLVTHDSWILPLLNAKIYGICKGKIVFKGSLEKLIENKRLWEILGFRPPKYLLERADASSLRNVILEYRKKIGMTV